MGATAALCIRSSTRLGMHASRQQLLYSSLGVQHAAAVPVAHWAAPCCRMSLPCSCLSYPATPAPCICVQDVAPAWLVPLSCASPQHTSPAAMNQQSCPSPAMSLSHGAAASAGQYEMKIHNWSTFKHMPHDECIVGEEFEVAGHKWVLKFFPGTCMLVYVVLCWDRPTNQQHPCRTGRRMNNCCCAKL